MAEAAAVVVGWASPLRRVIVRGGPTTIAGKLLLGEEAIPTWLFDKLEMLLADAMEVTLAADGAEPWMVVMETPDSVAMLARKLEAAEGSRVNVSEGRVAVGMTVTVTVTFESSSLSEDVAEGRDTDSEMVEVAE